MSVQCGVLVQKKDNCQNLNQVFYQYQFPGFNNFRAVKLFIFGEAWVKGI